MSSEYVCETCFDTGECMDMACYGDAPVEIMVTCPDCDGLSADEDFSEQDMANYRLAAAGKALRKEIVIQAKTILRLQDENNSMKATVEELTAKVSEQEKALKGCFCQEILDSHKRKSKEFVRELDLE